MLLTDAVDVDIESLPQSLIIHCESSLEAAPILDALWRRILCLHGSGCGQCRSCTLYAYEHPDFLRLQPEGPGRTIKIDSVRALTVFALQGAQLGGRKLVLIEEAERMQAPTANALLKTLEEPPVGVYIVLVTRIPSLLMPTVRSRCQRWRCPIELKIDKALLSRITASLKAIIEGTIDPLVVSAEWAAGDIEAIYYTLMQWVHQQVKMGVPLFELYDQIFEHYVYWQRAAHLNQQLCFDVILSNWAKYEHNTDGSRKLRHTTRDNHAQH